MSRSRDHTGEAPQDIGHHSPGVKLFLKGMAMGAADLVPGVSGGTIAFISGIYEELIESLKRCNPAALLTWRREGLRAFWRQLNAAFLVTLLLGILTSVVLLAGLIDQALTHYPRQVMAFFFGLVLASARHIAPGRSHWRPRHCLLLAAGIGTAAVITLLPPLEGAETHWFVFFSGMVAITAMILPGLSGAFILLLLGMYDTILSALATGDFALIAVFALGCLSGLMSFAHGLSWLLRHYHTGTLIYLLGILLGSLYSLWPWQAGSAAADMTSLVSCLALAVAGAVLIRLISDRAKRGETAYRH